MIVVTVDGLGVTVMRVISAPSASFMCTPVAVKSASGMRKRALASALVADGDNAPPA
jgi:hypothetical protein